MQQHMISQGVCSPLAPEVVYKCQPRPKADLVEESPSDSAAAQAKASAEDGVDDWRAAAQTAAEECEKEKKSRRKADPLPKLEPSATSWAAQRLSPKDESSDVIRKMKGILNKLTIEKFDKLYEQLLECGINTEEHIGALMKEVFEKATTQHHFIEMYTTLCKKLSEWFIEMKICDEGGIFKRCLANQCQDSFEKYLKPPAGLGDLSGEELFEAQMKYKTKMLGNMKFIGQLLIHKMLSPRVIFKCTEELLFYNSEETIETLCAFLTTIGPVFDTKEWKLFSAVLKRMRALTEKKSSMSRRVRCLIKDVLDLQASGWSLRRVGETVAPTTIAEVHEQWARDNAETDRARGHSVDGDWEIAGPPRKLAVPVPLAGAPSSPARKPKNKPSTPH